jgi:hypothetical protein
MADDMSYEILSTQGITYIDQSNNPARGVQIRFGFKSNHTGEIVVAESELNTDIPKKRILDYITGVRNLEKGAF